MLEIDFNYVKDSLIMFNLWEIIVNNYNKYRSSEDSTWIISKLIVLPYSFLIFCVIFVSNKLLMILLFPIFLITFYNLFVRES